MTAEAPPAGSGVYRDSLARHDAAFAELLGMIPAKFYLPAVIDEDAAPTNTKFQKNKRKTQKQKEAEERKDARAAAKRAKVRRNTANELDPANAKSVEQVQAERREQEEEEQEEEEEVEEEVDDGEDDGEDDDGEDVGEDGGEDGGEAASATPAPAPPTRRASIDELRERLHSKIETLRRKRNPSYDDASSGKQALLEERRRQRGELRDRRRRERTEARKHAASGPARAPGLLVPEKRAEAPAPESLSFSQVSFNTAGVPDAVKKSKYALPSDPKAALAVLEARKRKEEARAQRDGDDGGAREEAHRWGRAMAAAGGVKLRDNEAMLKQTIKRREKSKAKSAKAWSDRRKAEDDARAAKQKKRMDNIAARKNAKKGKSGKPRPGFEGARSALGSSKGARTQHKR